MGIQPLALRQRLQLQIPRQTGHAHLGFSFASKTFSPYLYNITENYYHGYHEPSTESQQMSQAILCSPEIQKGLKFLDTKVITTNNLYGSV